ncbi:hypothetical protein RGUI_4358 (plasmid) [Rhodovulum sp. P5]|uniref:hypothetical protein n=1 Tax=Rhodovulum sp. P5 TaxID=1564506 RepID=UPI0009C30BA3|nr:hypothetical protein [Rhodovulum sp. P5]ARE42384.1 hypothetical protein RGUI_4358 [Rhodovulum sp. P5]
MRPAVLSLSLCAALITQQAPAQIVPEGMCAVTVASRPTLEDVRAYVENDLPDTFKSTLRVVQTRNGWYAIMIGDVPAESFERRKSDYMAQGLVPADTYCSAGKGFVAVVPQADYTSDTDVSEGTAPSDIRAHFIEAVKARAEQQGISFRLRYEGFSQVGTASDVENVVRSYLDLLDAAPGMYLDNILFASGSCVLIGPAIDAMAAFRMSGDVLAKTQDAGFGHLLLEKHPEAVPFFAGWGLFDGGIMRIAYEKEKEFWSFLDMGGFCE